MISITAPSISKGSQKEELKQLFKLALPTMVTQLLRFLNPSISIMVCGHLSREELDASSLAITLINVLGLSVDTGFATAFDTLFSQAYGSKQQKVLGLILQRALCVVFVMFTVLACIHVNIGPVLMLLRQDPLISSLTTEYLKYFLPGLACDFLFLTFGRYLQAQNIVLPMLFSSCLGTVFNVSMQYLFVVRLNLGLRTSALCLSSAFAFMLLCELIYLRSSEAFAESWPGINIEAALSHWGIIFRMGIPGLFMVALEEWCFEMLTFIAGSMNEITLGAHAIAFQIQSIIYMVPLGIFTAVNIRVGQRLGAFDPFGARFAYITALRLIPIVALCTAGPVILLKDKLPYLFTEDIDVCRLASTLLPMLLLFQFCEGFAGVSEAVLLACGRQSVGAFTIFLGYYCVGMPLAFILAYHTSLGLHGAWLGLVIGFGITTIVYTLMAWGTNWTAEARQAYKNVTSQQVPSTSSSIVAENDVENVYNCIATELTPAFPDCIQLNSVQAEKEATILGPALPNVSVYSKRTPKHGRYHALLSGQYRIRLLLLFLLIGTWVTSSYISLNQPPPIWKTRCSINPSVPNATLPSYCSRMSDEANHFPFTIWSTPSSVHVNRIHDVLLHDDTHDSISWYTD